MLEAGVEMGLSAQQHDVLEMRVVDVRINSEQALENDLDDCLKVSGEWNAKGARENLLVVELVLNPRHEEVDVLAGGDLEWRLHVVAISPEVLVLGPRGHRRARLSGAKLRQDAIENVNLIIELDGVHGEPLVEIFTSWQLDGKLHVSTAERHSSDLLQTIATSSLLNLLLLLE